VVCAIFFDLRCGHLRELGINIVETIPMKKELERRLINLAILINSICNRLDQCYLSYHLAKQITRSSTSAALNYGEAQVAESRKDFIHKISISLKELKETSITLKLLDNKAKGSLKENIIVAMNECDQMVAIFHKTVLTARKNIK
jgi:four helix bundle protein